MYERKGRAEHDKGDICIESPVCWSRFTFEQKTTHGRWFKMQGKRNVKCEKQQVVQQRCGTRGETSEGRQKTTEYSTIGSGYSAIQLSSLLLAVPAHAGEPDVCSKIFCQSVSYHKMSSTSLSFKGIFWVSSSVCGWNVCMWLVCLCMKTPHHRLSWKYTLEMDVQLNTVNPRAFLGTGLPSWWKPMSCILTGRSDILATKKRPVWKSLLKKAKNFNRKRKKKVFFKRENVQFVSLYFSLMFNSTYPRGGRGSFLGRPGWDKNDDPELPGQKKRKRNKTLPFWWKLLLRGQFGTRPNRHDVCFFFFLFQN